jgi:alanine racemase
MTEHLRPVWSEVDLGAIRHNARVLAELAEPAGVLAVVKADGYGHGATEVGRAALDAGATWLGVALVEEGVELRDAGIDARIMVLSEPPPAAAPTVVALQLTPMVYTANGVEALAKAVADTGADDPLAVHLKVDTGMHRVGCSPDDAVALVDAVRARSELHLEGVCTHLAVADEPDNPYTGQQLDRFDELLAALDARGERPVLVHAANSAGLIAHERSRYDLVRCGIALYGIPPAASFAGQVDLRPALSLKARVSHLKSLTAGSTVSYGRHYALDRDARVATVPVGYADGVPRNLGLRGGEVLIRGRRFPIAGAVTMDQLMVDLGGRIDVGDVAIEVGDEVVLVGSQGPDQEITAGEWAERLGMIPYEVTTGISDRVPRLYRS